VRTRTQAKEATKKQKVERQNEHTQTWCTNTQKCINANPENKVKPTKKTRKKAGESHNNDCSIALSEHNKRARKKKRKTRTNSKTGQPKPPQQKQTT